MRLLKVLSAAALVLLGVLVSAGVAGAATHHHHHGGGGPGRHHHTYDCTGGNISPGWYDSIRVSGVCFMPAGNVVIRHDLTIERHALLDTVAPGDPTAKPQLPAVVTVGGNVYVGKGSVLLLGCSPNIACPNAVTQDRIRGSLTAFGALGVVIHNVTIGRDLTIIGGGGGVVGGTESGVCDGDPATNTPAPVPPLWAADPLLANGEGPGVPLPVYSDAEDNIVGGNLTIVGLHSCWLGALRNVVGRSMTVAANKMGDPDAMEIDNNLVRHDMACFRNLPAAQFGDGMAAPNVVGHRTAGECGFGVEQPDPATESGSTGPLEHISVKAGSLGHYSGTHVQTASTPTDVGTTVSGDMLTTAANTDTFAGSGLTGTASEQFIATTYPNGTSTFEAQDTCTSCSFDGQTGGVTIRAYGFISAKGTVVGYFLVAGSSGGLFGLAGWGTFNSFHQPDNTVALNEHLSLT